MSTQTLVIGGSIIGVVVLVILWQVRKDAIAAAGTLANAVNPVNHDNAFASSVNAVGSAVSGNTDWTLGGWIYDVTHPATMSAP